MPSQEKPVKERLDALSVKIPECGCWVFIGSVNNKGYGQFFVEKISGKAIHKLAHRVSYEAYKGIIPNGMKLLHSCDNPSCINPDHLSLGSQMDNMTDCAKKGRRSGKQSRRSGLEYKSRGGRVRKPLHLTNDQATEMARRAWAGESQRNLAKEYGLVQQTVSKIAHGKHWQYPSILNILERQ